MHPFVTLALVSFLSGCSNTPSSKTDDPTAVGDCASNPGACDEDGDGFRPSEGDCDDADAAVNPSEVEACNGKDENCNGEVDEGVTQSWYPDADHDGFGDPNAASSACEAPAGFIPNGTDCDDAAAAAFPGATETCDGVDNDCDGTIDNGVTSVWYADTDGDGYGDAASSQVACEGPEGFVTDSTDCDDGSGSVHPGLDEVCDELDNDCDGTVDEGMTTTFWADIDGDGFGNAAMSQDACALPTGYSVNDTDCDDMQVSSYPGATEVCNDFDDDCDGTIDEPDAADSSTWYADTDADGYGNAAVSQAACDQPAGYVTDGTDCNDVQALSNPGNAEVCDSVDND